MSSEKKLEPTIFTTMSQLATDHKAINLGQGFPDFDTDPQLIKLVSEKLSDGFNQYAPMQGLPALRETLAEKINKLYGSKIGPSQICVTAGATQAIFTAVLSQIGDGDEVIFFEPAYDCYKPAIEIAKAKTISYQMEGPDYSIDWQIVEKMVTKRTRMIIINTPHNPTGTILRKDDLLNLEKLVNGKNIVVLSDEVYEHIIFDEEPHESVLKYPSLSDQSLAVYSFGKTLHATGWKLGYIAGAQHLIDSFLSVHQWNVFCVNSFLQHAIAEYLQQPETYLSIPGFYEKKREYLTEALSKVPLKPIKSAGTYFQLYDYNEVSVDDDITFAQYLTKEVGVAVIPLSPFSSNPGNERLIRMCFAKNEETIDRAAKRLRLLT